MRTAIILLILLALASIPGSLLPQRGVASDPSAVQNFYLKHPDLAPWLDQLSLFNVYSASWFGAIYVLLLISMTGCVVPRCARLWRESRSAPPAAPRRLEREQNHVVVEVSDADGALDDAAAHLRRRHYRVQRDDEGIRAERGHVRELGNLAFHLSLLVLLVGVAAGRLFGYEGRVALVEDSTFVNVASSYDALSPAPWADLNDLEPLELTLDDFDATFETEGPRFGEPRAFTAQVSHRSAGGTTTSSVRPNAPLDVNGTKFFLTGHGYAPQLTVRDGNGDIAASGPTIFLPMDPNFTSDGVLKVPDAAPEPLAFQGLFLPTAVEDPQGLAVSAYPGPVNPVVQLTAFTGDLGLNDGSAQSVFALDTTNLDQVRTNDGEKWRVTLTPGETVRLPNGLGSITFDGVSRFANFQIARDPGKEISLVAAALLLCGLTVSLSVRRQRVWVRRIDEHSIELAVRTLSRHLRSPAVMSELVTLAQQSSANPRERSKPEHG